MSGRASIGSAKVRKQSDAHLPEMEMVKVAVMPPRLPPGMAPPTGLGPADTFSWDESINWSHNEPIQNAEKKEEKKKSFRSKIGLTAQRSRRNEDLPPFTFRQVPYDTWRKHYAKDANGNYHGTHAPAEDCILKPEDVAKWRLEEPKTNADRFTRGQSALPVYSEIRNDTAPGIDDEHAFVMPPGYGSDQNQTFEPAIDTHRKTIADGKTAEQIIAEAMNKPKPTAKQSMKAMLSNGARFTMMGS